MPNSRGVVPITLNKHWAYCLIGICGHIYIYIYIIMVIILYTAYYSEPSSRSTVLFSIYSIHYLSLSLSFLFCTYCCHWYYIVLEYNCVLYNNNNNIYTGFGSLIISVTNDMFSFELARCTYECVRQYYTKRAYSKRERNLFFFRQGCVVVLVAPYHTVYIHV